MSTETSNKITRLSFWLAVFVMLIHVTNFRLYGINQGAVYISESFIESVANYAVPMFFAISGYLFYRNYRPEYAAEKLKKRFRTVFIPWMIWGVIYSLFFAVLSYLPILNSIVNQRTAFLGGVLNLFTIRESTHLWYLRNLVIYIVAAPVLYFALRYKWSLPAYVILMFGCYQFLYDRNYSISMYSMFFVLGGGAAIHLRTTVEQAYSKQLRTTAFLGLVLIWIVTWRIGRAPYVFFAYLLGLPLIWIAADGFRRVRPVSEFMKSSFFIYVSHLLILESVEKVFWILLPRNQAGALVDYLFAPVITLGIIYLAEVVLKKSSTLWNLLTGNRG